MKRISLYALKTFVMLLAIANRCLCTKYKRDIHKCKFRE